MTSRHSRSKPTPIAEHMAKGTTPLLAAHLSVVVHADGSLSWHVGRLDPASRRMTFPYAGVTAAPYPSNPQLVPTITMAVAELLDLDRLMGA